jgi:predicted anti-sigma-YlaC factor YlaD
MTDKISCKECADFLDDFLAGTLEAQVAATFQDHLDKCPPCQNFLDSYKETIRIGKMCCCPGETKAVPEAIVRAILDAMKQR